MRHLLSVDDLRDDDLYGLIHEIGLLKKKEKPVWPIFAGRTMATFFAEPSTRTRFSFERAMHLLGGNVITSADAETSSSLKKGESIKDTFRTLSQYCELIVCRQYHYLMPEMARKYSRVPVINAGSVKEHPTQALLDLFTIYDEFGRSPNGMNIMIAGDLMYSRTVPSLIKLLSKYNCNITLCPAAIEESSGWSHPLDLPAELLPFVQDGTARYLGNQGRNALKYTDVVYMTRIQKERIVAFSSGGEAKIQALSIGKEELDLLPKHARILHPLPRGLEISEECDDDPRAAYHERQVQNGVWTRVAVVKFLLDLVDKA